MPVWLQRIYLQLLLRIVVGDYRDYGLPLPDHKLFEHHPTINTELLHYLKHGRINVCRDIKMLDGNFVHFLDGERDQFDIVICATGYNVSFPFLSDGIIATSGPVVKVRWGMVAPEHKQLYVYGWAQARYGFGPLLTPASDLLADLIALQNELKHSLGKILEKLRQPLAESHLLDPMDALRQIRAARKMLKILPLVDKSFN